MDNAWQMDSTCKREVGKEYLPQKNSPAKFPPSTQGRQAIGYDSAIPASVIDPLNPCTLCAVISLPS
jgi:hypothetical protein